MGMATIAAIYYVYIDTLGDEIRGPGVVVAHHDGIGAQGLDGASGINEGLPFLSAATGRTEIDYVGA